MLTGVIGIISWFYLPPSPTQTPSKFRGKEGWFNEREEKISKSLPWPSTRCPKPSTINRLTVVNRIFRDDPSKGDMHNRQALSFGMLWECLSDYHMWFIYIIGLTWLIPTQPMTAYLTLQLRSIGFDTFETNLLTV